MHFERKFIIKLIDLRWGEQYHLCIPIYAFSCVASILPTKNLFWSGTAHTIRFCFLSNVSSVYVPSFFICEKEHVHFSLLYHRVYCFLSSSSFSSLIWPMKNFLYFLRHSSGSWQRTGRTCDSPTLFGISERNLFKLKENHSLSPQLIHTALWEKKLWQTTHTAVLIVPVSHKYIYHIKNIISSVNKHKLSKSRLACLLMLSHWRRRYARWMKRRKKGAVAHLSTTFMQEIVHTHTHVHAYHFYLNSYTNFYIHTSFIVIITIISWLYRPRVSCVFLTISVLSENSSATQHEYYECEAHTKKTRKIRTHTKLHVQNTFCSFLV